MPDSQPSSSATSAVWTEAEVNAYLDRPLMFGKAPCPGTSGMTLRDIEQDILNGGRFVIHHWCLSVVVMTFTRGSKVRYIRSWESGLGRAASYSLLSTMLGWWGFPFGLVYTPLTLWRNGRGGTDVTEEMLAQILGPSRAQSVLAQARPRKVDGRHWPLFFLCLAAPMLLVVALITRAS